MKEGETLEPRYTVEAYYKGFRILLTQPFENGGAIVGLLDKMVEAGFTPTSGVIYKAPDTEHKELPPNNEDNHVCPIHNVAMRRYEKNGHSWYSHQTPEGWCNGKPK